MLGTIGARLAVLTVAASAIVLMLTGADASGHGSAVDAGRIAAAARGEWLPTGRTYDEQRFSPPAQIDHVNVDKLGLGVCHGDSAIGGTLVPDLRRSVVLNDPATWQQIVHDDALKTRGMVSFAPVMTATEIESIRAYVIKRANEDNALEQAKTASRATDYGTL